MIERLPDGTDEWLTPRHIVDTVGPFDLDPCSTVTRPWPTAGRHLTIEDDGLAHRWQGMKCNNCGWIAPHLEKNSYVEAMHQLPKRWTVRKELSSRERGEQLLLEVPKGEIEKARATNTSPSGEILNGNGDVYQMSGCHRIVTADLKARLAKSKRAGISERRQ